MNKNTLKDRLGYLSYSKLALWEKSPQQFWLVYFEGVDKFRSKELELGKKMAKYLETKENPDNDEELARIAKLIPDYPNKEFEIRENLEGIPLLGFLDGFDEDNLIVHEVKTGKKFSQSMVDKSSQLTFYALLVWLKYGVMPKGYFLYWAETKKTPEGEIVFTGNLKIFKTTRRFKDIIAISARIRKAWKQINELKNFSGCK